MKFRFKALERQRHPDQLDSPLLLASPQGWVAVFTVLITTVMIGLWAFLGSLPRSISVDGMVSYSGGVESVEAAVAGSVTRLAVAPGQVVSSGDVLATVRDRFGNDTQVTSLADGRVIAIPSGLGSYVAAGDVVASVERIDNAEQPLSATLLVSGDLVPFVHIDQQVNMSVPGVNPRAFGRLKGVVTAVSDYPATAPIEGSQESPVYAVDVQLLPDAATVSGYAWTSASGPPAELRSRTPVHAELSLGGVRPVSYLLGL
ncbi:HlyD family efflux transporter periplasmic adaptor subunit [Nostocoides australiense]|nr:HlyD family efflux transporter periplasmic adaptor subunit [Tetrasphaera australiensis]